MKHPTRTRRPRQMHPAPLCLSLQDEAGSAVEAEEGKAAPDLQGGGDDLKEEEEEEVDEGAVQDETSPRIREVRWCSADGGGGCVRVLRGSIFSSLARFHEK